MVMMVIWFLVAISILVAFHEYGHFIVARLCGVKVLRFSIGFGPRLLSVKDKYGTEFAISALPLGGYVKMLDEREGEVSENERHMSFNSKTVGQRIAIAAAGPAANILLACILYTAFFMNGTQALTPVIGHVEKDSMALTAGLGGGQTIVAIDGKDALTRRDVQLALLERIGETGSIQFTTTYPDTSLTYDSVIHIEDWLSDAEEPNVLASLGLRFFAPDGVIREVQVGTAAEKAGIQAGDKLVAINGIETAYFQDWANVISANPSLPIPIVLERDGKAVPLTLIPSKKIVGKDTKGFAGVVFSHQPYPKDMIVTQHYGLWGGFIKSLEETQQSISFVFMSMKKLLMGQISIKNLSGPIGIAKVAADQAQYGVWAFIAFLAQLSVALAVLNILPIPMLDGGHILYCIAEWVKGSPLSERVQYIGLHVGMALLLSVMVVAFYFDILRF